MTKKTETSTSAMITAARARGLIWGVKGTATTTLQIMNLIGRVRKNKRAARAARIFEQFQSTVKLPYLPF